MAIDDFLPRSGGRVRISLTDGSVHHGAFRTDLLSVDTVSAFFVGDIRSISLPIDLIASMEAIGDAALAA